MGRLFVYGTLRPGSHNPYAERLAKSSRHAGTGTVRGRLYRVAHYPALGAARSEEDRVRGDLFEDVTEELLGWLDEYEGEDYSRETVNVILEDSVSVDAYVYRYLLPTESLEWIRSGDWKQPDGNPLKEDKR